MKLVDITHPVLLKKAKPVTNIDQKIKKIIADMKRVLIKSDIGIGLAAPQVGISLQIFLMAPKLPDSKNKKNERIDVYINPVIIKQSKPKKLIQNKTLEGCLSIPEIWGHVERSKQVTLEYINEAGTKHTKEFKDYTATIVQHEVDHLSGILFTQRVMEQGRSLYRSNANDLEEIDI